MEGIIQLLSKKGGNTDALAKFIKNFEETYGIKQKTMTTTNRERANKSPMRVFKTEAKRSNSNLQSPSALDISAVH